MSGPKKSTWQMRNEIRESIKRERENRRRMQVNQIFNELSICENKLRNIELKYGKEANFTARRVKEWINDVKNDCNYDLRDAWNSLRGIKIFLDKQEVELKKRALKIRKFKKEQEKIERLKQEKIERLKQEKIERLKQKEIERLKQEKIERLKQKEIERLKQEKEEIERLKQKEIERLKQEKEEIERLKQEKIERAIASLISIKENHPEIINRGIEQRIELFTKSLNINPDNQQTKKQILQFREQLKKKIEEFEEKKDNINYITKVFSEALGSDNSEDSSGNTIIKGSIEGVPITVQIDKNSNNINFDTPTDGSCKKGLNALINKLENANINLGPITVINTGEKINNKNSTYNKKKIDA